MNDEDIIKLLEVKLNYIKAIQEAQESDLKFPEFYMTQIHREINNSLDIINKKGE